jgi:hypothetical protein
VAPARILAVVGETATETEAGGGGGGVVTDLEAVPQEARAMAARNTNRKRKNGRRAEDMVRIV